MLELLLSSVITLRFEMPHYNVYVRDEDDEAFLAIKNRPEWLHRAIEDTTRPSINHPILVPETPIVKQLPVVIEHPDADSDTFIDPDDLL